MTVKVKNKVTLEARGTSVELLPSQVLLVRAGDIAAAGRLDRNQLVELRSQIDEVLSKAEVA